MLNSVLWHLTKYRFSCFKFNNHYYSITVGAVLKTVEKLLNKKSYINLYLSLFE